MKFKTHVIIGFFMMTVYAGTGHSQEPQYVGEKINFSIKQMGITVGEATLIFLEPTASNEKKNPLIKFTANALNFSDVERIYLDPQTLYPIRVTRDLNLWGRKEKIVEDYLQDQGLIKIVKHVGKKITEQTLEKEGPIDNIYSFIYRYRKTGEFQIGEELQLNLPTKDVVLFLDKSTTVKALDGRQDAFYLFSKPRKYKIWFDKSDDKVPLRIDGAIGLAKTSMVIKGFSKIVGY